MSEEVGAQFTGDLVVRSPDSDLQRIGPGGGQDVVYAPFLEFGTSRIEPRLFLGKSVAEEEPILQEELGTALKMTLDFTK